MATLSRSKEDREYQKFELTKSELTAVRVITYDSSIYSDDSSKQITLFNEISSVPQNIETLILTHTALELNYIDAIYVSGDNLAYYAVYLNDVKIADCRTWWTSFNETISLGRILNMDDNIKVKVITHRPDLGAYSARLKGVKL